MSKPAIKRKLPVASADAADGATAPKKFKFVKSHSNGHGHSHGGKPGEKKQVALSRHDRRDLRRERRALRPHHELISEANQLYKFALNRMEPNERRAKIEALLDTTLPNLRELLSKHDTSRVYQLMAKHGSSEQRARLAEAARPHYLELAKDHYAHHFLLKLAQYGTPVHRQLMVDAWRGRIEELAFHTDGAQCLDLVFALEKSKAKQQRMIAEMLHPTLKLAIDDGGEAAMGLADICARQPALKSALIENVLHHLDKFITKGQLQLRLVQFLLHELVTSGLLTINQRSDLVSSLASSPALPALCAGNDSGAMVLSWMLLAGGAKDRKLVLRAMKGRVKELSQSQFGHLTVMRALALVDDTVQVSKTVWADIATDAESLRAFALDGHGSKILAAHFLQPEKNTLLSPFEVQFLKKTQIDGVSHSKKDPAVRCHEHAAYALDTLVSLSHSVTDELIAAAHTGSLLIAAINEAQHVMDTAESAIQTPALHAKRDALRSALDGSVSALAAFLCDAEHGERLEAKNCHFFAKRALSVKAGEGEVPSSFARSLAHAIVSGADAAWISAACAINRGCFLLLALLQAADADTATALLTLLSEPGAQASVDAQVAKTTEKEKSGAALLRKALDAAISQPNARTRPRAPLAKGNKIV